MSNAKKWRYWIALPIILLAYILCKHTGQSLTLLFMRVALLSICYVAAVWDIIEQRIPNQLVLLLAGVWFVFLIPLLVFSQTEALAVFLQGMIGFAFAAMVTLIVYFVSRKGLGGGDVKLMSVAGLYLGYAGVLSALLYGALLAAVVAIILLLCKKMTAKDTIPLVPFLYVGVLVVEFIR